MINTNNPDELSPDEALAELASLLAAALLRMQKTRDSGTCPNSAQPGLELSDGTVLSVTSGLLPETPKRERER